MAPDDQSSLNDHTGDDHTGDDHTGDDHTGDDHTGDDHTGDDHTGDDHTGDDYTGDDYTGEVSPGGPAQTRTAGRLQITKVAVDPKMSNNCYLLRCSDTGDQVLIDAADEAGRLLELIGDGGLTTVVTTHQHWDHHRALAEVVSATGATVVAGEPDADAITEQTGVTVDQRVGAGDRIPVGTCSLLVIPVAGHTPGSICLLHDDGSGHPHLFTGDSLFPGGVGNTQGDAERFQQLISDVSERIFAPLPDATWFYPGHGNDSTLGAERPHVAEWRDRGW